MKLEENTPERVLEVMRTRPGGWFVYDLMKAAKLGPGDVYVVLAELENRGLVTSEWEQPEGEGPRRRLYSVAKGNER